MTIIKKTVCATILILPLVLITADTSSEHTIGAELAHISEIDSVVGDVVVITGTTNSTSGSFTAPTFVLTVSNNSMHGYAVAMKSNDGGLLSDATGASASTDGDFIDLTWSCTSVLGVGDVSIVTTNNADVDLSADTYSDMLIISNPSVATAATTSTCSSDLASGEIAHELLANPLTAVIYGSVYTFRITSDTNAN